MIVFDLECRSGGHRFEGWFGSSDDFASQQERGLVCCPFCQSADVTKAVMAPNVGRKGNQIAEVRPQSGKTPQPMTNSGPEIPPEAVAMIRAIAEAQAEAIKSSRWVGESFAKEARAIHYGDKDPEPIHGQASIDEARDLHEEGIAVAPILFPVIPPDQAN